MSIITQVLVWTAAILGLFLLYNIIFPSSIPAQYNIACYHAPHAINHTSELIARIAHAKHAATPAFYQYSSAVVEEKEFQKKVMQVAFSFDKYVQQLAQEQELRHQDLQIHQAINQSKWNYQQCQFQIQNSVNSSECLHNWQEYQNCFTQVNQLQSSLDTLLATERSLQQRIQVEIQQPQTDHEDSPEIRAEKIYNDSMRKNEGELQDFRQRLAEAETKLVYSKQVKDKAEDRLEIKEHTYKECWQNRRIYRQCEEISQQVKNLNLGTLQQLEQQLEAKRRLLEEMRDMIIRMGKNQHRKMPEHWSQMYQTHVLEFKQMHKDYIHYNTQMERKACGCTEDQEKNYLIEVERQKKLISDHEEELRKVHAIINRLRISIQEKEAQRDRIIAEYQQALKEYATSAPIIRESQLMKLKKLLESNRRDILDKENDFNAIDKRCKAIKRRLADTVKDVDKVEACLSKKQYLEKLRAQTAKYLEPSKSITQLYERKKLLRDALLALDM